MSTRKDVVTSLAEQVAELLPGEWSVDPFPADWGRAGAYMRERGSQAIVIIGESQEPADRDKNRLSVSTDYPRDRDGSPSGAEHPRITVSASKTAEQVARDVELCLLPRYLPLLEKEVASITSRHEYADKTEQVAEQVARVVRVRREPRETQVSFYRSPYDVFRETMSGASVVGDDEVELTLRLDATTTLKVLNLLVRERFKIPEGLD